MAATKDQAIQANFLLRYSLQAFGVIVLIAIFARFFLISSYVMSGAAMLPTIWPGDFLIGSKLGLAVAQRGEVVAIRCPSPEETLCLKRVVGLPGDRIEIRAGQLILNGQPARQISTSQGPFATEVLAGVSWTIWPSDETQTVEAVIVPPQSLYLMNDKRADLDDSRTWGMVTESQVEGRIVRVWLSLDWFDGDRVRPWPRVRWRRLGHGID